MFRALSHILVSLLLMISITGFAVSKHYCGNEQISVEINKEAFFCCDMEQNCCHNETDYYQLEDDFFVSAYHLVKELSEQESLFPVLYTYLNIEIYNNDSLFVKTTESPPPKKNHDRLSFLQSYLC
ncbi:MAG TPA: hypothetical protein VK982_14535 [Bacteroidales bacterium]|nr:hypothetical protein [Bacteroidales bacterium]